MNTFNQIVHGRKTKLPGLELVTVLIVGARFAYRTSAACDMLQMSGTQSLANRPDEKQDRAGAHLRGS